MRKHDLGLVQWGDWNLRHMDHTGLPSINLVEKYFYQPGGGGVPGHRILAPEAPRSVREYERAVSKLSNREQQAVTLKYCAPLAPDGNVYTHRQLARKLGISKDAFEKALTRGKRRIRGFIGVAQ